MARITYDESLKRRVKFLERRWAEATREIEDLETRLNQQTVAADFAAQENERLRREKHRLEIALRRERGE